MGGQNAIAFNPLSWYMVNVHVYRQTTALRHNAL